MVGGLEDKEEIEGTVLYSFEIADITREEAEVAAELEAEMRKRGLRLKGENWRIDLFIARSPTRSPITSSQKTLISRKY